jgi:hypothetical protein
MSCSGVERSLSGFVAATLEKMAFERQAFGVQPIQSMMPTIATQTVNVLAKMVAVVSIVSYSCGVLMQGPLGPRDVGKLSTVCALDCELVHNRCDFLAPRQ